MRSLDEFAAAQARRARARRTCAAGWSRPPAWTASGSLRDGRRLLSFSCNDYLNLTHHPAIKAAAIAALQRYGIGSGASRLVTGNHPLFAELEARLARLKGTEAACVFGSGYLANTGIIPALVGADDLVLIDELAHACLWAGARLAARHGAAVPPLRRRARCGAADAAPRPPSARADRHRRRVLHGRRPRAAPRAGGARRERSTPGC